VDESSPVDSCLWVVATVRSGFTSWGLGVLERGEFTQIPFYIMWGM
jgi:hypothetical protein